MKKVLEDLYFGEIEPNVSDCKDNPQLQKSIQIVSENEDVLLKLLEGKERELFLDLVNAQSEVDGNTAAISFIDGFKLGARIIAESIMD